MRPNLGRAVLRAVASGDPEVADRVAQFHRLVTELITCAYHGRAPNLDALVAASDDEAHRAFLLQQIWFASLVGWMSGLHSETTVFEQMERATAIVLS